MTIQASVFIDKLTSLTERLGADADLLMYLFIFAATAVLVAALVLIRRRAQSVPVAVESFDSASLLMIVNELKFELKKTMEHLRGETGYIRQELVVLRDMLYERELQSGEDAAAPKEHDRELVSGY